MKRERLCKKALCVSQGCPVLEERAEKHLSTKASGGGKEAVYATKKLIFILILIAMTSVTTFAATDVLFLIDTTGSASGPIGNLKTAFDGILDALAESYCAANIMYGVADYKNYGDGGNYTAYGVNLDQSFTYGIQDVLSAIDDLSAGGGGTPQESQLKAMVSITDNWTTSTGDLGFNGRDDAQKIIIWAGDMPGHVAEDNPDYYPTLDATIDALIAQRIIIFALNPADYNSGLNALYRGHQQASEITDATGGILFNNVGSDSSEIEDAIVNAIKCYTFIKDDDLDDANDLDCRSPGQELTYSICWINDSDQTLENPYIIDWLPDGVDYEFILSLDPLVIDENYNIEEHYYRWELDDIDLDENACVELEVTVNDNALPGGDLHNVAELYGTVWVATDPNDPNMVTPETRLLAVAVKDTLVCCWQDMPEVLYVDKTAVEGVNSGLDWPNAFTNLQDALVYARSGVCGQVQSIYVAQGDYSPGENESDHFELPTNCSVYGGFPSGGCDFSQRNPKKYKPTLTGYINATTRNTTVVLMADETLLDGFSVTNSAQHAIYGDDADFTLENCTVEKNWDYGVYIEDSNTAIKWCTIRNNDSDGIYHQGESFELTIENCWIRQSGQYGVVCRDSTPMIINSVVSESDMENGGREGIRMINPASTPLLYNLTVSHNKAAGISLAGSTLPDIQNCIVYHNNDGNNQLTGFSADSAAHYCCIQDCNSVNNNISLDPEFVYFDPNNVHISYRSPCKDSGSLLLNYDAQVDMDSRVRVLGTKVDRGAYEVDPDCESDSNVFDTNHDGLVNYVELTAFSQAWLSRDPNDPSLPNDPNLIDPNDFTNWNPYCDLNEDYTVNLPDIVIFVNDAPWLWKACWVANGDLIAMQVDESKMLLMSGSEALIMLAESEVALETSIVQKKSTPKQLFDLASAIVFLEQIWLQGPGIQQEIDTEAWQNFMESIYQNLLELKVKSVQLE